MKYNFKYVTRTVTRHGRVAYYFRRPEKPKIRLYGEPGTKAFAEAYERALAHDAGTGRAPVPPRPVRPRVKPHSFEWLLRQFMASPEWQDLKPSTRDVRRRILLNICKESGDRDIRDISSKAIRAGRDKRRDTPAAANTYVITLRVLFAWAIEADLMDTNPAIGIKKLKQRTDGFRPWTPDECKAFEAVHPIGTNARTAFALALYAGLRRSDVVCVGRQHMTSANTLRLTQTKTDQVVEVPILPPLKAALEAAPTSGLHFVETVHGKPFSAKGFGMRFKAWTAAAGLPDDCTLHGLRKALGNRLADRGLSDFEIAAVLGHNGTASVKTYTSAFNRRAAAEAAMRTLSEEIVPPSVEAGE